MPSNVCRLYFDADALTATLPVDVNGVTLAESESVQPLRGKAASVHRSGRYVLECADVESGDAMLVVHGVADALTLGSDGIVQHRAFAAVEAGFEHVSIVDEKPLWRVAGPLDDDAVAFARRHAAQIVSWSRTETFNRPANAFRLYSTALTTRSPDAALVLLVSCLEGLFSAGSDSISYRVSLAIANFLHDAPKERQRQFQEAKAVYTARSKIVHGAALAKGEERAAILLVDNILPQAEEVARRSIKRLLDDGLVELFKGDRADLLLTLLALGFDRAAATAVASGGSSK